MPDSTHQAPGCEQGVGVWVCGDGKRVGFSKALSPHQARPFPKHPLPLLPTQGAPGGGWGVKALAPAAWPVRVKKDHPEGGHALLGLQVKAEVCLGGQQAGPARGVEEGWEPPQGSSSGNTACSSALIFLRATKGRGDGGGGGWGRV